VVKVKNVNKYFGHLHVLRDLSLDVSKGEVVVVIGPSGSGKSTLLRCLNYLEPVQSGEIWIDGIRLDHHKTNIRAVRAEVGIVFQSFNLFPHLTALRNVMLAPRVVRKRPEAEVRQAAVAMLTKVGLQEKIDVYPSQLSGGQQQRVALARALAVHPQVLLLDEPLSALDAKIRLELRVEIRRIQQELGITTMYVTHDQEEALSLSDRVVVMNAGRTEQVGPPFEIYNFPQTPFVASFVGTLNLLRCKVLDAAKGKLTFDGQTFETRAPVKAAPGDQVEVMLRPEGLHVGATPGENHLVGKVQMVNFLGSIVRVRLGLGESLITLDMLNERGSTPPEAGQSLAVSGAPDACWIVIRT